MVAIVGFGHEADDAAAKRKAEIVQGLVEAFISQDDSVTLVERRKIRELLGELALSRSGFVAREAALRIGKLARADLLLYGNFHRANGAHVLRACLVEARTGKIRRTYTCKTADASEAVAAAELASVITHAAKGGRPGPSLAVATFRQARGMGRLAFFGKALRGLLVTDFDRTGAFVVLEREDMRALVDEIDLAGSGLTEEGVGDASAREAFYLLSGEYEEVQKEGRLGVRIRCSVRRVGAVGEDTCTFEGAMDELSGLRAELVGWVAERCSVRASRRGSGSATEFDWLLARAVLLMSRMEGGYKMDMIPGVKRPLSRSGRGFPISLDCNDGPAFNATVAMAMNLLECAAFIRPDDARPKLLLALCLVRHQDWMYEGARRQEVVAMAERAEALAKSVMNSAPRGAMGAAARRLLPGVYNFARQHAGSSDETAKRLPWLRKYLVALVSCYEDTPPELRTTLDVGMLRTASHEWTPRSA